MTWVSHKFHLQMADLLVCLGLGLSSLNLITPADLPVSSTAGIGPFTSAHTIPLHRTNFIKHGLIGSKVRCSGSGFVLLLFSHGAACDPICLTTLLQRPHPALSDFSFCYDWCPIVGKCCFSLFALQRLWMFCASGFGLSREIFELTESYPSLELGCVFG